MSRPLTFGIKLLCGPFIVVIVFIGFFVMPAMASDRFVDHGDGSVTDTKTGLMWAAKDNGSPINWPNALSYCQNYSGGGHTDWRMPTLAELTSLYDPKDKNKRGYHVNKLIDTSAQSCWASEIRGFKAARFNFIYGQAYCVLPVSMRSLNFFSSVVSYWIFRYG